MTLAIHLVSDGLTVSLYPNNFIMPFIQTTFVSCSHLPDFGRTRNKQGTIKENRSHCLLVAEQEQKLDLVRDT